MAWLSSRRLVAFFGKGSQRERPLSGEHDLGDIDGYVCAEGLAETGLRDVEVGALEVRPGAS